ncbi:MAG: glycosyltransferase family 39 protein [Planctomycetota bacterium]|jgi:hypothetical protein
MMDSQPQGLEKQPSHPPIWREWLLLFVAFLALYALTANRGAQWQDSGEHIWRIVSGQLVSARGLALTHPLHYHACSLASYLGMSEPAWAITLVSALAGALAIANCYGCVVTLTGSPQAARYAAISLGVAHTMWQFSTRTETYTLGVALMSGEIWAILLFARTGRPGYALLLALLNGLGIANHMLASLTTPVVLAVAWAGYYRSNLTKKHLLAGLLLWIVGGLPYSSLVVDEWITSGNLAATLSSALFGHEFASAVLSATPSGRNLGITASFLVFNFPSLLLPMALCGMNHAWRSKLDVLVNRVLLATLVIHALFAFRYDVIDQYTFFLPTYLMLAVFGGLGFAALSSPSRPGRNRLLPVLAVILLVCTPLFYAIAPVAARKLNILEDVDRRKPYRDDYTYILTPWSVVEDSAQRMSRHVVSLLADDTLIVIEDGMAEPAIRYQAWMAGKKAIEIVRYDQLPGGQFGRNRPVVLVPLERDHPRLVVPAGQWQRDGDVYLYTPD